MPNSNTDPNGQDPQDQDDDDLDQSDTGAGDGDDSSNDGEGGHKPTGSDFDKMTPEQLKAEALKLREENARRRQREKELKEQQRQQQKKADQAKTDAEKLAALEASDKEKDRRIASLAVGSELRDYLAENHPEYLKLSKRIVPFVDLDGLDLDDEDSVREKVKEAVEDFVKDVPISATGNGTPPTDSSGRPVGGVGRAPSRGGTPDTQASARRAQLFPGIYKTPRQG